MSDLEMLGYSKIPNFIGTYDIDYMPQIIKKLPAAFIVNTLKRDSKTKIGHYFAVIIYKTSVSLFDPLGLYSLKLSCLKQYLDKLGLPIHANNKQIQLLYSPNCGIFTLVFLYLQMVKKLSFETFMSLFSHMYDTDSYICYLFKLYFNHKCKSFIKKLS